MAETSEVVQTNEEKLYVFRFGTSNKVVQLTQQQLDHFPYLSALVTHEDDFSIAKKNGEYVMSSRIRYTWFMSIFQSIITKQPSALFTKLPQEVSALGMLHLYDYLCINPLPVPLLKDEDLVRWNSNDISNEQRRVEYHQANLSEAHDTAVQFIIALSKNEYNLHDFKTLQRIFSLIMVILSNLNVFGSRLCHHTLTVVKKYCFSFFSHKQQYQLHSAQQSVGNNEADSVMYVYDDDQQLPVNFENAFAWKGIYVLKEENDDAQRRSNSNSNSIDYYSIFRLNFFGNMNLFTDYYNLNWLYSNTINVFDLPGLQGGLVLPGFYRPRLEFAREYFKRQKKNYRWFSLRSSISEFNLCHLLRLTQARVSSIIDNPDDNEFHIYQIKQEQKNNKVQSARSGCFNTVPKRSNIDKFKHRFGPKTRKYR